jgi:dihydrodipicolinate synthase/N-acetylneuraminate lyase
LTEKETHSDEGAMLRHRVRAITFSHPMTSPDHARPAPHLIAALVTPFTAEHRVDRASLGALVRHLQRGGIAEFFAVGSTGEAPLLDDADRQVVIATVRDAAPTGRVFAGISGAGPRAAIRLAQAARRAGADVGVLMSPNFIALDQGQLAAYAEMIADGSDLPLALYHHLRMPTPFAVPTVARLAAHPNIIALKDTSGGDHNRCAEILAATAGQPFEFYQGVEKLVLPTLAAGGHGCVVAQACIAPRLFRTLFDTWGRGDLGGAETVQTKITALWEIFTRPEVRQSFSHFLYTLKRPLQQRGVLATTAGAVPGVALAPEFERMVAAFMREHLPAETGPATA